MGADASPLSDNDVAALLQTVMLVGSASRSGTLPLDMHLRLRRRLVVEGLLPREAPLSAVTDLLEALSQPLHELAARREDASARRAAAQMAELPVENPLAFTDEAMEAAFVDAMRRVGKQVDPPVHEEGLGRWVVIVRGPRHPDGQVHDEIGREAEAAVELGGWHLGVD